MPNIIRTGGGTVKLTTYLYKDGDECIALTGGWDFVVTQGGGTSTKNAAEITTVTTSAKIQRGIVNAINLTNYSKLKIKYKLNSKGAAYLCYAGIQTGKSTTWATWAASQVAALVVSESAVGSVLTAELDISSLNSSYYLTFGSADIVNSSLYEMWLE